jgi:formylglycine-generating enzyme required for sulfatase activity
LPTESEWEYACRAGTLTEFSFGNNYAQLGKYASFEPKDRDTMQPVGIRLPNAFGLFDMHGSVWEWCDDTFGIDNARSPSPNVLRMPGTDVTRVARGGAVCRPPAPFDCRSASRTGLAANARSDSHGFRIVSVIDMHDGSKAAD